MNIQEKLQQLYEQRDAIQTKIEVLEEMCEEEIIDDVKESDKKFDRIAHRVMSAKNNAKVDLPEYSRPPSPEERGIKKEEWIEGGDRPNVSYEAMGTGDILSSL